MYLCALCLCSQLGAFIRRSLIKSIHKSVVCGLLSSNLLHQHISAVSIVAILFLALVLSIRTVQCVVNPFAESSTSSVPRNINLWPTNNGEGILHGLPVFFCSYVAHFK